MFRIFRWLFGIDRRAAAQRARTLLRVNLTPAQLRQLDEELHFDVIGGATGRRYRVHDDTIINVDEYDTAGQKIARLCFVPNANLPQGDVLLAQKCALELFESDAQAVARRYPTR
jgi:hypothetical protein